MSLGQHIEAHFGLWTLILFQMGSFVGYVLNDLAHLWGLNAS